MKKVIFALMLIVVLVLSGCKAAADGAEDIKTATEQKWTYTFYTGVCAFDAERQDLVCKDPVTKDETLLTNLIGTKASSGFELDDILVTTKGKGLAQTFIFRKPYVEPVAIETEIPE